MKTLIKIRATSHKIKTKVKKREIQVPGYQSGGRMAPLFVILFPRLEMKGMNRNLPCALYKERLPVF